MVKTILTDAGFVEGSTFKETRFRNPPQTTYAIFLDSFTGRGSDDLNLIKDHDYTIELYSDTPDPDAEARIESVLNKYGIEYEKEPRYWIDEEQLYQVVYRFNFIEK